MGSKVRLITDADVDESALVESVTSILAENTLCSMATLRTNDGIPYINTAYFAFGSRFEMYVFTAPSSQHGLNLAVNGQTAVTVFDTHQEWGTDLKGLQLFGATGQAKGTTAVAAFSAYAKRFAGLLKWTKAYSDVERVFESRFFVFTPTQIKVFDEPRFGKENYITAEVS